MGTTYFDYKDEHYIVVGASSGIGKQVVLDIVNAGGSILAVARDNERLQRLKAVNPDRIEIASIDVNKCDHEQWMQTILKYVSTHKKVNGAVYTAGIGGMTPLRTYDRDYSKLIMDTSVFGASEFLSAVSKKKCSNAGASYVVISSVSGYVGEKGAFAYSAAKSAVRTMVKSFAKELVKNGTRINSISPGLIATEMSSNVDEEYDNAQSIVNKHPLGIGNPSDISNMVLYLLSDSARWITGQDYIVDGGYMGAYN